MNMVRNAIPCPLFFLALVALVFTPVASAESTGLFPVVKLDSLSTANERFVSLGGYFDARCDANRILIRHPDPEHRQVLFTMLLSALIAARRVEIQFTVDGPQCVGDRVIIE